MRRGPHANWAGVPQVALGALEAQPKAVRLGATALEDTLVAAYLTAYADGQPLVPFDGALHACAHALAKLAVVVMAPYEA